MIATLDAPPALTAQPGGPAELAALIRQTVEGGARRELLLWRPALAVPGGARALHRRLIDEAAAPLRRAPRIRLFSLPDGTLVAAVLPPALALETAEASLRAVLDPAAAAVALHRLRLPEDAPRLLALLEASLIGDRAAPAIAPDGAEMRTGPATLQALARADLSAHLLRQPVRRLDPEGGAGPAWVDERPNWPALVAHLGGASGERPDAPLRAAVAARQAAELGRAGPGAGAVSLPLAPAALATGDWLRMDQALPQAMRQRVILCLDLGDLLRAPGPAMMAVRFAGLRGYRVALEVAAAGALDLLTPALLQAMGPGALLRLGWSELLPASVSAMGGLQSLGAETWLAGADRSGAVAWGWSQGLRLFQGSLVDRLR
ncbi:hypothetical protein C8P66_102109 [Humitalea rosea]|uniref:EAL domain-containing protein n=1 Tax=Humitalea rosea TaxID=990373 RepID=A0A2W7IS44_9PROT|nr:hypothetical protein [Humitalea rosea]PZW50421.1 hypothetical protein C8P66_102109 [Humitalea rosea]